MSYHQNGEGVHTLPRTASHTMAAMPDEHTPTAVRHIPISTWLLALGLAEYEDVFSEFSGVEDLLGLSESDIRDLGVRNHAHRARMVSSLVIYKQKINAKKMSRGNLKTSPGSSGNTPPSSSNHADYATVTMPTSQLPAARVAQVLLGVANNREQPSMRDLSQFGWYHGNIPRQKAESLLHREGDFLVRDSLSQLGDFVLSVFWGGLPLHFVLNKSAIEGSGGTRYEYQFEDVQFDRPSELIFHYVEHRKIITEMSGAIISNPILRTVPLDFYDSKPPDGNSPRGSPWGSPKISPQGSPSVQRKLSRPHRSGSQPLLSLDELDSEPPQSITRKSSMPSLEQKLCALPVTSVDSVPTRNYSSLQHKRTALHQRTGSEPVSMKQPPLPAPRPIQSSLANSDTNLSRNPPPKPSRIPTIRKSIDQRPVVQIRNAELYQDDGRDYSDYDQIKSWPSSLPRPSNAEKMKSDILRNSGKAESGIFHMYDVPRSNRNAQLMYDVPRSTSTSSPTTTESLHHATPIKFTLADITMTTNFDLLLYDSELLTPNNKPLEPSAVTTIKSLLLESNAKVIAQHMTFIDLKLLKVIGKHDLGLGIYSGLELLTLPHGKVIRQDIMERYHCLSLFVGLTTLMCSMIQDRAKMLHQWIQIAIELRGNFGNLFGFSAIMHGLNSPQVSRLKMTWKALKTAHSDSAFMYEKRLKGLLETLDNASATLPLQNITIPHIIPLVELLQTESADQMKTGSSLDGILGHFDVILVHLDTARIITQQCGLYRVTAENLMSEFRERRDLADMLRTEMHLKLLWGSRGASVSFAERHHKFPAILDLLSQRVEPAQSKDKESSL